MSWLQFGADELALGRFSVSAPATCRCTSDVGVEVLHERHRLVLVLLKRQICVCDEDVATAGQQRARKDELALHAGSRQVVPRRRLLAADLLVRRSLLEMKPKMPVYQPVQSLSAP